VKILYLQTFSLALIIPVSAQELPSKPSTMKLYIISLLFFGPTIVLADRVIRFTFNSTQTCTAADNIKIDAIFDTALVVRRQLRDSTSTHRGLSLYCKNNCAGTVPYTCRATGCSGYAGRRASDTAGTTDERALQVPLPTCATQVSAVDAKLDLLISTNAVSTSCKAFLNKSLRKRECFDDVVYGVLESIRLWNVTNVAKPTVISNDVTTNLTICKSLKFNLEAVVNPCVNFVKFRVVGPSGSNYFLNRTENSIPYTMFSSVNGAMGGRDMDFPGTYNFTIVPDGFVTKMRAFSFKVSDKC
jgi:hypothetical protein